MRRKRKLVSIVLLATAIMMVAATAVSAGGPESFKKASKKAQALGVPLLVEFTAEWCKGCKSFDQATATDKHLIQALDQVVLYKVDGEKGEGAKLAKHFKVKSFPNFVMLGQKGKMINRWAGYGDSEQFIEALEMTLDDPITIDARMARYEKKATAADAEVLARIHLAESDYKKAVDLYRTACKLDGNRKADLAYPIFQATAYGMKSSAFGEKEVFQAADGVLKYGNASGEDLCYMAKTMSHVAKKAGNPKLQKPYLEAAMNSIANTNDKKLLEFRAGMQVNYALVVEGNVDKALNLKRKCMPAAWTEDAMQLNSFAWWCFENNVNLAEADQLARKGAELAPDGKKKAMVLDTVAEICNARGSCNSALEWIQLALAEDPENQYYKDQFERFQEIIAQAD